jgi:hypothetical protein
VEVLGCAHLRTPVRAVARPPPLPPSHTWVPPTPAPPRTEFEGATLDGRAHRHALASLFSPDGPNDVAPSGDDAPEPHPDGGAESALAALTTDAGL